ncbi:hypothetical protein XaC1_437 [Xanthomonas phage XaC1]|nr:hypothetical protein XaC1_437 [Xanthomonas phage XaC1]
MTIQEQLDYIRKNLTSCEYDKDFQTAVQFYNYCGSYIEIRTVFFSDEVNDKSLWIKYKENDQYFIAYEERGFVVNRIAVIKNQVNLYNGCYFSNSSNIDVEPRLCNTEDLDTSLLFNLIIDGFGDFKPCVDAYKLMVEMKDTIQSTFREAGWS